MLQFDGSCITWKKKTPLASIITVGLVDYFLSIFISGKKCEKVAFIELTHLNVSQ